MNRTRPDKALVFVQLGLFFLTSLCAETKTVDFLVVKYGDDSAVPELAKEFLEELGTFLEKYLEGGTARGWIANSPETAEQLLQKQQPILAFAPPGFYFQHLSDRSQASEVLLQVPRFGTTSESFYVVVSKASGLTFEKLKGGQIHTTFAFDPQYLERVVFPSGFRPGTDFELAPSPNLADAMFLMLEEAPSNSRTVSALLLDEELRVFFQQDDLVWPELEVVWRSEELPRDVVVTIGSDWTAANKKKLKEGLLNMHRDPLGRDLLRLMNSSGMQPANSEQLEDAHRLYSSPK